MKNNIKAVEQAGAGIAGGNNYSEDVSAPRFTADFECVGADGLPKWRTKFKNVVVDQGKGLLINRAFGFASNSSQVWYMGLHSGTNITNSTMVISGGGSQGATASEVGNYGANRPSITFASTYTTGQATATALRPAPRLSRARSSCAALRRRRLPLAATSTPSAGSLPPARCRATTRSTSLCR
jgi:hypothetical protein